MGFFLAVLSYVFYSLGLYTISCRRGIAHPWLSWVPFISCFQLGCVVDHYKLTRIERQGIMRWVLLILGAVNAAVFVGFALLFILVAAEMAFGMITFGMMFANEGFTMALSQNLEQLGIVILFSPLLCVPYWLAKLVAQYQLYKSSRPDLAVVFLILNIFLPFVTPVLIMICKDRDDGMVPEYLY